MIRRRLERLEQRSAVMRAEPFTVHVIYEIVDSSGAVVDVEERTVVIELTARGVA